MAKINILKDTRIGSGGYSTVCRATELGSGRIVALKQSRVSLFVNRPLLHHECAVLHLLSGHVAIPNVFAYGRLQHFEVLSMELLHRSLGDVATEDGPLALGICRDVTEQLLAALEHIHTHGIVHRDIKPDNILLRYPGQWQVCVIDFGLAIRPRKVIETRPVDPSAPGISGTVMFASLSAHNNTDLTYRDDLESLAYTLIYLLKGGSLPWSHYMRHGTRLGRLSQVHEQKKRYDGAKLSVGLPLEYGTLLDYARSLPANRLPDYATWRERVVDSSESVNLLQQDSDSLDALEDRQVQTNPPSSPAKRGQVILLRLLPALSIEGYSGQVGHESYVHDETLDKHAPWRPAVVTDIQWDDKVRLYRVTVVAVGRRPPGAGAKADDITSSLFSSVPISSDPSTSTSSDADIVTILGPEPWPYHDSMCYVLQQPSTFYCLPQQPQIPSHWKTNESGLCTLEEKLVPPWNPLTSCYDQTSSEADLRHHARMRRTRVPLYAELAALTPRESESIDWQYERAWFDESIAATRHRNLDDGWWWTGAVFSKDGRFPGYLTDSYCYSDFSLWQDRQQERDSSLTLRDELDGDLGGVEGKFAFDWLDEIIALEPVG